MEKWKILIECNKNQHKGRFLECIKRAISIRGDKTAQNFATKTTSKSYTLSFLTLSSVQPGISPVPFVWNLTGSACRSSIFQLLKPDEVHTFAQMMHFEARLLTSCKENRLDVLADSSAPAHQKHRRSGRYLCSCRSTENISSRYSRVSGELKQVKFRVATWFVCDGGAACFLTCLLVFF
jgi:hypothetical protein